MHATILILVIWVLLQTTNITITVINRIVSQQFVPMYLLLIIGTNRYRFNFKASCKHFKIVDTCIYIFCECLNSSNMCT